MKKFSLFPSLMCMIFFSIVSCDKTSYKAVEERNFSDMPVGSVDTGASSAVKSVIKSEDSLALKLKDYIISKYLKPEDLRVIDPGERKFHMQQIDLNSDAKKEIFISFYTPYFCGSGGCTLLLLDSKLKLINRFTVIRTPITVDSQTENGWKVLWFKEGNSWKKLMNKNGKYPSNPSLVKPTEEVPETDAVKLFDTDTSKSYSF
ncbi:hypothetical protein ASG01_09380 [Chryseobacterium sp. Leaf180]|uniref:hypothetical protein n=1 Tax=Chryseobacterium sp. Leaf180 TaxID=1736289 RepID=UPI0006F6215F|nr:hypothetical protein [Chryseobacterium sp. Leaf180]KQR93389.1 hypothetical protein ASG01_09380 [Chryseobacterium sp. Leaf180]